MPEKTANPSKQPEQEKRADATKLPHAPPKQEKPPDQTATKSAASVLADKTAAAEKSADKDATKQPASTPENKKPNAKSAVAVEPKVAEKADLVQPKVTAQKSQPTAEQKKTAASTKAAAKAVDANKNEAKAPVKPAKSEVPIFQTPTVPAEKTTDPKAAPKSDEKKSDILGYPEATVPFYSYDWAASNRTSRIFLDVYGIDDLTSVVGTCPSCSKNSLQGTYVSTTHTSRGHQQYYECYLCHYVQNLGTYVYKDHGDGSYGSWTCPSCGSHTWVLDYDQDATCTSNGYRSYSCACGQTKRETVYSSGHSYRYGSWEQYSGSKHRRETYCRNCGDSDYEYANHSLSYGSWSKYSDSQHSRSTSCDTCGYSTTEYGNHSYSAGSWSSYNDTQHRRTKSCATCGDSTYEYADHADSNGDGKCDNCGAIVSLTVTWDAGTNGGKIGGKASISETVTPNSKPTAPSDVPTKTGHTFKGWYTASSGGSLYSTVTTITSAKTFYAQFEANVYTVTWDLGTGETATSNRTYGEKLVLPTEPERKNAEFLGWFTEADGGTEVTTSTIFTAEADTTYYAHWEITEVLSATVPVTLPLVVDESGEVHTGEASIINTSTGAVQVSSVSITAKNGWTLVPFDTDMAHEKVDAKLLGFQINTAQTSKTGTSETFTLSAPWTIAENGKLPLNYDAVVSAVSQAVTEQDVLSIVFVLEWAED